MEMIIISCISSSIEYMNCQSAIEVSGMELWRYSCWTDL